MPPKKNTKRKALPKAKPKSKSPLNQYKLPEIKAMAKSYGIVLSRKNKGQLIKEIEAYLKKNKTQSPKKVQRVYSREIVFDSRQGGKIIECVNGVCRQAKIIPKRPPPVKNIRKEKLFLPDVIGFMQENEPDFF